MPSVEYPPTKQRVWYKPTSRAAGFLAVASGRHDYMYLATDPGGSATIAAHVHAFIYLYIYIYIQICVCV